MTAGPALAEDAPSKQDTPPAPQVDDTETPKQEDAADLEEEGSLWRSFRNNFRLTVWGSFERRSPRLSHSVLRLVEHPVLKSENIDIIVDTPLGSPSYSTQYTNFLGSNGKATIIRYSPAGTYTYSFFLPMVLPYVEKVKLEQSDFYEYDNRLVVESFLGIVGYHQSDRKILNIGNSGLQNGASSVTINSKSFGLHMSRYSYQVNEFMRWMLTAINSGIDPFTGKQSSTEREDGDGGGGFMVVPIVMPGIEYYYVSNTYRYTDLSGADRVEKRSGVGLGWGVYGGIYGQAPTPLGPLWVSAFGHSFSVTEFVRAPGDDRSLFSAEKNKVKNRGFNILVGLLF